MLDKMEQMKITQKQLAERMNCSQQYISKILKGKENLSLETLTKIENALEGSKLISPLPFSQTHASSPPYTAPFSSSIYEVPPKHLQKYRFYNATTPAKSLHHQRSTPVISPKQQPTEKQSTIAIQLFFFLCILPFSAPYTKPNDS